jgi:hypothetical protein
MNFGKLGVEEDGLARLARHVAARRRAPSTADVRPAGSKPGVAKALPRTPKHRTEQRVAHGVAQTDVERWREPGAAHPRPTLVVSQFATPPRSVDWHVLDSIATSTANWQTGGKSKTRNQVLPLIPRL